MHCAAPAVACGTMLMGLLRTASLMPPEEKLFQASAGGSLGKDRELLPFVGFFHTRNQSLWPQSSWLSLHWERVPQAWCSLPVKLGEAGC